MEALGTTYCEEEHRRTLKRLASGGMVNKGAFVEWYAKWVTGDEEDEEEDDDASDATGEGANPEDEAAAAATWAKLSSTQPGWKCSVCAVRNAMEAAKCVACETPNPDAPAGSSAASPKPAAGGGSIGAGGFSFGGGGFGVGACLLYTSPSPRDRG